VAFVVMPVFALSNAGVSFSGNFIEQATSAVAVGVALGLLIGKMIGIFGVSSLLIKLKWVPSPEGVTYKHLLGMGFIAAIGFTMSLFINELAFSPLGEVGSQYIAQAKIGIIIASVIGGFTGFFLLKSIKKPEKVPDEI
jgi:NhaA family Na+:H+ antiporter